MDIKRLSPQNLFGRFVATLLVLLLGQISNLTGVVLPIERLFIFSLVTVLIFSLWMMLFYAIMVQYLMKKRKPTFLEALLCRYAHWPIHLICLGLMNFVFQFLWSFAVVMGQWFFIEIVVYFIQMMLGTKRRNDYAR